jgi:hypothetical protein
VRISLDALRQLPRRATDAYKQVAEAEGAASLAALPAEVFVLVGPIPVSAGPIILPPDIVRC